MLDYQTYKVSRKDREPLVVFMREALESQGCTIINASSPDIAPFRLTFETSLGERMGIVAYAFLANSEPTKNRPLDEHRFQIKYGSKTKGEHVLWADPYGLYTTLLVGIDPDRGFFVAADPVLHSPTKFFISLEFKREDVEHILKSHWWAWERARRKGSSEPVEVLVGGTPDNFLHYVRFEREAFGEDQGHRHWLADKFESPLERVEAAKGQIDVPADHVHVLAKEFQLGTDEVMDLIQCAPRLKMAVRGWVAEVHLQRHLAKVPGVTECEMLEEEGGADIRLRYHNSRPLLIECKNTLRAPTNAGVPRLDFQRTRASKGDPCSRFYSRDDFDAVAACLHAVTSKWEFRFSTTTTLAPHKTCVEKLSNSVHVDNSWTPDASSVLEQLARRRSA